MTRFHLSTIGDLKYETMQDWPSNPVNTMETAKIANKYGLGLEIAEYCNSSLLDVSFEKTDLFIKEKIKGFDSIILHAPFNEIYPSAIDHKAVELAYDRLTAAYRAAKDYSAKKMVVHSGFVPTIYYESWFEERSIIFWKNFLRDNNVDIEICVENVMETHPDIILNVLKKVDDERLKMTLDIGHAFVVDSKYDIDTWIENCAEYTSHYHIHNNTGEFDTHSPLDEGGICMEKALEKAFKLTPEATYTVECAKTEKCALWLKNQGFLNN